MSNSNYVKGRAFEYAVRKSLQEEGYEVMRTAGSHGHFDLIAIKPSQPVIELVQCKVVKNHAAADRLIKGFRSAPPYAPYGLPNGVHQMLYVKIHGVSGWGRVIV